MNQDIDESSSIRNPAINGLGRVQPDWTRFGNFNARIVRDRRRLDGTAATGPVEFEIEVCIEGGSPQHGTIAASDFDNTARLVSTLRSIGRTKLRLDPRSQQELRQAILDASEADEETAYTHTGWTTINGQDHFLMPGHTVGPAQPMVELPDHGGLRHYGFRTLTEDEMREALHALVGPVLGAMPDRIALPVVAHAFLPPLHRFLPTTQKSILHLEGQTGTQKTSFAMLMMALWGQEFASGMPPASWGSTVNAIEQIGFHAKDALLLVDDYKPAMVAPRQVTRFLQNAADGVGRERLNSSYDLHTSRRVRAHLLSTGEDTPTGEASVLARMLVLRVEPGDARLRELSEAQAKAHLLAGLLPRFVGWLLATPDLDERVRERFTRERQAYGHALRLEGVANRDRVAQNVAMNAVAFAFLVDWLEAEEAISESDAAVLRWEYGDAADAMIAVMAGAVRTERASEIFVRGIGSLLSSGRFMIATQPQAPVVGGKTELGWQDRDVVYLNNNAFHEVNRVSPLNVSERALHQQLRADGMLADTDPDQLTVRRRRHGRQQRVLALRAEVLGLEDQTSPGVRMVESGREDIIVSEALYAGIGVDRGLA